MDEKDKWMSVQDAADELGYSRRQAWELVKRLGIRCIGPTRSVMGRARFRRSDFDEALARSLAPVEPQPSPEPEPEQQAPPRSRRRPGPAKHDTHHDGPDHLPRGDWRRVVLDRKG